MGNSLFCSLGPLSFSLQPYFQIHSNLMPPPPRPSRKYLSICWNSEFQLPLWGAIPKLPPGGQREERQDGGWGKGGSLGLWYVILFMYNGIDRIQSQYQLALKRLACPRVSFWVILLQGFLSSFLFLLRLVSFFFLHPVLTRAFVTVLITPGWVSERHTHTYTRLRTG